MSGPVAGLEGFPNGADIGDHETMPVAPMDRGYPIVID
jgi:hypothetical protein